MKYPIAIEPPENDNQAYGVAVPDLPGCFSAGSTLAEAIENSKEAIALWMETALELGEAIPGPRTVDDHASDPDYAGWIWEVVEVNVGVLGREKCSKAMETI